MTHLAHGTLAVDPPAELPTSGILSADSLLFLAAGLALGLAVWLLERLRRRSPQGSPEEFPHPLATIIVEKSPTAVLAIRLADDQVLALNPAARRLLESEAFKADNASALRSRISRVVALGTSPAFEMAFPAENGRLLHIEIRANLAEWNGSPCAVATCRDVSQKVELERTLATTRETKTCSFDAAPSAILICDQESGQILEANREAMSLFGTLNPQSAWSDLTPNHLTQSPRMLLADGRSVQMQIESRPTNWNGRSCVVRFCTPQREDLESFTLLDQMTEAILLIDPQSLVVVAFNRVARHLYGYSPEELKGLSVDRLTIDAKGCRRICLGVLASGPLLKEILSIRRANGEMIPVEANFSAARFEGRQVVLCSMRQVAPRPAAMPQAIPAPAIRPEPPLKELKPTGLPTQTIMVVDDEPMVRDVISRMLASAGWNTLTAADGHQAMRLLEAEPAISAVILDSTMPGMNGLELCRLIRSRRPALPVVLCSGYGSDAIPPDLIANRPALQFVHKPFTMESLIACVESAIRPEPMSTVSCGPTEPVPQQGG